MKADFDNSKFDAEQVEYLQEFLEDFRTEVARGLIHFVIDVPRNGDKESHKRAIQARIVSRAALLDRILNKREVTAREIPNTYGVSIHQYYDTLQEVEQMLRENNNKIREIIRIK